MNDHTRAQAHDTSFYRALITGLLVGAPTAWALLTLLFAVTSNTGWGTAFAYSALPALVVGPFLGGLVTTTVVDRSVAADEAGVATSVEPQVTRDEAARAA